MSPPTPPIRLAILDDWANISARHFSNLNGVQVDQFPDTLDPANSSALEQLKTRLEPYTVICTMRERTPFPKELLIALPNLRLLLTTGLRNAAIDLPTCKDRGILVAGTTGARPNPSSSSADATTPAPPPPGYDSTTQHTWSLLLSLTSRIATDSPHLSSTPTAWQSGLTIPLGGRTLGLVGLGKLGGSVARIALAFGMKVIAWSESLTQEKADAAAERQGLGKGCFRAVGKEELFKMADVVSVHYVLSERSRGIVGAKELDLMKKTAVLVNTSRGPLIDEAALLAVLQQGKIRGAALDVFWEEPLSRDSPWRTTAWGTDGRSEVVLSPHMGYVNEATMSTWYEEQAGVVERWVRGEEVPNRIE